MPAAVRCMEKMYLRIFHTTPLYGAHVTLNIILFITITSLFLHIKKMLQNLKPYKKMRQCFLKGFFYILLICLCMLSPLCASACVCVCLCVCTHRRVSGHHICRNQRATHVSPFWFFPPITLFRGSKSAHQSWWPMLFPPEPCSQP